ncbi:MAG: PhoH family protein [Planctomycetota bacterium]|nr:MAG: PhoH family protein [Planctomycetota bacterium]
MNTLQIPLTPEDDIRLLFGPQDIYLRQIRDHLGVGITLRGENLILDGAQDRLQKARDTLEQLLPLVRRKGVLKDDDLTRVLRIIPLTNEPSPDARIDLFEKARSVKPRTRGQEGYVDAMRQSELVFCTGPAGCGKTYLAVAMAVNALRRQTIRKIVLVRPAVEAGEKLGFLPGDMMQKVNPYLRPLLDAMSDMLTFEQVQRYMTEDVIEILPLAFMRGRTLNNTFMILDEGQNTTTTQMKMFLTRMGEGSRIVVTGDTTQSDLPPSMKSGLLDAVHRLRKIHGVSVVELTGADIVRHRLVREIVEAYDDDSHKSSRHRP